MHILSRPPSFCECLCVWEGVGGWLGVAGQRAQGKGSGCDVLKDESVYICHVGVRSVCSCLRQMTCSAPQGPPVILHPLSPTDPTDGLRRVCTFVCVSAWVCVCEKFPMCTSCLMRFLVHARTGQCHPHVFVVAWRSLVPWTGGMGFFIMLIWEMGSGKSSNVKAQPCWIHRRGDTQAPAAK